MPRTGDRLCAEPAGWIRWNPKPRENAVSRGRKVASPFISAAAGRTRASNPRRVQRRELRATQVYPLPLSTHLESETFRWDTVDDDAPPLCARRDIHVRLLSIFLAQCSCNVTFPRFFSPINRHGVYIFTRDFFQSAHCDFCVRLLSIFRVYVASSYFVQDDTALCEGKNLYKIRNIYCVIHTNNIHMY